MFKTCFVMYVPSSLVNTYDSTGSGELFSSKIYISRRALAIYPFHHEKNGSDPEKIVVLAS